MNLFSSVRQSATKDLFSSCRSELLRILDAAEKKCSSKWLMLFVFAAKQQQFCCNELTILNLVPTSSWWWDLHTITPEYKTELLKCRHWTLEWDLIVTMCAFLEPADAGGYSSVTQSPRPPWSRFVKMSAPLRILKLAPARHLKLHIYFPDALIWIRHKYVISPVITHVWCLDVMRMMNWPIKVVFRRERSE